MADVLGRKRMSVFFHSLTVVSRDGETEEEIQALVDTGSTYLWLPSLLLERLGYQPVETRTVEIAGGQRIERGVAPIVVRLLNSPNLPVLGMFGDEGSIPLMGAIVLETFSLGVDPVNERLVPVVSFAL